MTDKAASGPSPLTITRQGASLKMGTPSPNPWDLPLCRQNGLLQGTGCACPQPIPAAESALRSHPCVAVSSAQVSPVYTRSRKKEHQTTHSSHFSVDSGRHMRQLKSSRPARVHWPVLRRPPLAGFDVTVEGFRRIFTARWMPSGRKLMPGWKVCGRTWNRDSP